MRLQIMKSKERTKNPSYYLSTMEFHTVCQIKDARQINSVDRNLSASFQIN